MGAKMEIRDSLHKKLEDTRMRLAMERALRQGMMELQKNVMKEAPVDTGNLRRSHSTEVRLGSDMVEGLLKNSTNYWQFVQFGTSRMDADDFVTRGAEATQVEKKIAEYFHTFYKT